MSSVTYAAKVAFSLSYVIYCITLTVILATIAYIVIGAKYLTVKRTIIQPVFIQILITLLVSTIGSLIWQGSCDGIYDYYKDT